MADGKTAHIFISYARDDGREFALQLRKDLDEAGYAVWLDTDEIGAGASWSRDIEEAIERCTVMLALLSEGAYVSDICRSEQLRALRKNKSVIPMLIQPDAERPIHLENLNYLDFSEPTAYIHIFPDLLHAISNGQVPERGKSGGRQNPTEPFLPPKSKTETGPALLARKRDARAFRRYLADLREESWLGDRHWWTYFLFYYDDVQAVAEILKSGRIDAPVLRHRAGRLQRTVQLFFRPRTPDLFGAEGIRPRSDRSPSYCPVPVYLVFDLEAVIALPEVRFSEGDVNVTQRTYKSATAFRDMPFDLIYHDAPFRKEERDEILNARRAQVFVPEWLDLTYLRHIWCRSTAEYETLYYLLPESIWRVWGDHITVREDYNLFNRKWLYVERATLSAEGALFEFSHCTTCKNFAVRAEIENDEEVFEIELGTMSLQGDLALDLTEYDMTEGYTLALYVDDSLAYAGRFIAAD